MAAPCGALSVFVRSADGQCREVQVPGDASVAALRDAAPFVGDKPLFFAGERLRDDVLLADAGIGMQTVVDVGDAADILRPDQIKPAPLPEDWDPHFNSVPVREKGGGRLAVLKAVQLRCSSDAEQYAKDVEGQMAAASIPQLLRLRGVWPIALAPAWMHRRHNPNGNAVCFLLWEYADGGNLQRVVDSRGPAPPAACAHLARQLLLAARHIVSPAAVLRPPWLRPQYVYIAGDGAVKVGGFSDHKSIQAKEYMDGPQMVNTDNIAYMSPHQLLSGEKSRPGGADEVHSVGLIAYYAACGRHWRPADDRSLMQFVRCIAEQPAAPALPDGCPDSMQRWLEQCFAAGRITGPHAEDALEAALSHPWLGESDEAAGARSFKEWLGAF
eukprot:TRINITY_DN3065_c0_g2_i1.p1 TRINITY_DN3065_c0_g2~~TRINITY_DN3065_c0_g2_i1.p1  ORF type:complete len:405 (+),score=99.50 TRINITY_DN3065_c0_g2_i1:61-1215(+)